MPSLDLNVDYKKIQDKITATKSYNDLKNQYNSVIKDAGKSFESSKSDVTQSINKVKEQTKSYQRELKNQFEQLLDITKITGGKGSNSLRYIKTKLIETIQSIEPKIAEILLDEAFNAVGCDQEQVYNAQSIYIKVNSIDLVNLLKTDPNEKTGKVLYEKTPVYVQDTPFSMNKELYNRIQSGQPYSVDYGRQYQGASGQNLFDIQYVETNNLGETGPWFKITLPNRLNNVNRVGDFMSDYYRTIKVVDKTNIMSRVMESLCGCISINGNVGLNNVEDASKFALLIQRVLGLCFDNDKEINVSGISKLAELDGVDESFFEFTDIDLRKIDQRVTNIKNGVIEFENCGNVKLPVDSDNILNELDKLNFIQDGDFVKSANNITNSLSNNPNWNNYTIDGNVNAEIDVNFIKLLTQGLITSLLSPKILLPIFTMLKALGQFLVDGVNSLVDFMKKFSKFAINVISRVGAIFVEALFIIIKKDIKNLIQQVILDLAKEKSNKKVIMILKLIQILLVVAQFVTDWRKCKSVVDELLSLLQIATTGWGGEMPLPILFASRLLGGYSETRAFIGAIEELQKLGIPTGPMPDGSPNLHVLSIFSQFKAMANEDAENGKVQVAIPPLAITPAGLTIPASGFGKKF
jgi:hypothetical protein